MNTSLMRHLRFLLSTDFEMTPADLLRTMRMESAERLLKTSQLSVAEVAYKVGFASHKYFSRCFKDHFGVAPTDVRRQGRTESPTDTVS